MFPDYAPSADELHITYTAMVNQLKKENDPEEVKKLMWKSMPDRRKMLLCSATTWADFFSRYPRLLSEEEVRQSEV